LAWLLPAVALTGAACVGSDHGLNLPPGIANFVCAPGDLPPNYLHQTEGDFSVEDLAGLSDNPGQRKRELKDAGLRGGHFNYWKQAAGGPPVGPPIDVVCQAMAFNTRDQATRFVAGLREMASDLATTGITWLPGGTRTAVEEKEGLDGLPAGSRAFRLDALDSRVRVTLYVVAMPSGIYVQTVYIGSSTGEATLTDATAIALKLVERTAAGISRPAVSPASTPTSAAR
jgi:hypothetical protein